jgi:hypothetical protein
MFARRIARIAVLSVTMGGAAVGMTIYPLTVRAAEDAKHQDRTGMPRSMGEFMKMDPEECMKMMDKEHKGHVTKKEFMKFQEELWQKMDKNRDDKADREEWVPPPG